MSESTEMTGHEMLGGPGRHDGGGVAGGRTTGSSPGETPDRAPGPSSNPEPGWAPGSPSEPVPGRSSGGAGSETMVSPSDLPSAAPSGQFGRPYADHYSGAAMDEIDLLDLVKVVWRARWAIVATTLIAAIIAFGVTFTKERVYESKGVFAIQTQPIPVGPEQGGGVAYNTAVLTSVLRSRQLSESVVEALSLDRVWDTTNRAAAVKRLENNMSINANDRDGVITVSFQSPDPVLARDVVANYVALFEERANELNVTEADRVVGFAEARLEEVGTQLTNAEARLVQFKERYGIVSFQQQTQSLVNAHAALTDRIRSLTVELTGKRSYLTDRDPEVQALLARIAELERQVRALELGNQAIDTQLDMDPALVDGDGLGPVSDVAQSPVPSDPAGAALSGSGIEQTLSFDFGLKDVPAIAMELQSLEREVEQQRQMYELLRKQHEAARLDASRKMNIVRLIDPPEVPGEPLSRGLVLNVALAAVVGAFAALMFAFIAEFLRQRAQDDATVRELPFLRFFRGRGTSA